MKANKNKIKELLNRYFEGLTTLEEEQILRDYFQQENVPEEWKMYQPMFQYFADQQKDCQGEQKDCHCELDSHSHDSHFRHWIFAAAACLLLLIGLKFTFNAQRSLPETSLAYIDGKKQTNIALIQKEALRALENLSEENDDVYSSQIDALDFFLENN